MPSEKLGQLMLSFSIFPTTICDVMLETVEKEAASISYDKMLNIDRFSGITTFLSEQG